MMPAERPPQHGLEVKGRSRRLDLMMEGYFQTSCGSNGSNYGSRERCQKSDVLKYKSILQISESHGPEILQMCQRARTPALRPSSKSCVVSPPVIENDRRGEMIDIDCLFRSIIQILEECSFQR